MLGNAILLANDYFPLSYRSLNEDEFKKALIIFYEQRACLGSFSQFGRGGLKLEFFEFGNFFFGAFNVLQVLLRG